MTLPSVLELKTGTLSALFGVLTVGGHSKQTPLASFSFG
jgi:hypothetical protein